MGCKCLLLLYLDLIAKRKIDIEKVKKIVDVVVSYDKEEAEMFGKQKDILEKSGITRE